MTLFSRQQGVAATATAIAIVLATTGCAEPAGEAIAKEAAPPTVPAGTPPANDQPPEAVLERAKADLAAREGVPVDAINVVTTRGVVWKDASMGCGEPGTSYPLIRIEGFLIILEHRGRQFEYRARADGAVVLCRRESSG